MSRRMRTSILAGVLAMVAAACGTTTADPIVEVSTTLPSASIATTTPPSSTTSAGTLSSTSTTTAPVVECPATVGADLDGDQLEDRADPAGICTGTGEVWVIDEATLGPVEALIASDVDGDRIDEVLLFDAVEPPTAGRVFEFDPASPTGLAPVTLGGAPLSLDYSYYSGEAAPAGEQWFGCADLDGSGVERLVHGTFVFDAAAGETQWSLQPIEWGADLVATEGATVTGSYPAGEAGVSDLMPGRRFCKDQGFSVAIADGCSADDLTAPPTPSVLGPAAAATYRAIVDAALACDFHELERIAGDQITLSFGGHDDVAAFLARGEYQWPGEPLRILVQLMAMEPGYQDDFDTWVWPTFWADDEPATPAERAEIEAIFGRPFDDILVEDLGYIDYRIGIDTAGKWLYFVAGD